MPATLASCCFFFVCFGLVFSVLFLLLFLQLEKYSTVLAPCMDSFFFIYIYIYIFFFWSIVDLKYFRFTAKWFSYTHTHILFFRLFSIIGYYKKKYGMCHEFVSSLHSSVQLLSHVRLFVTPWTAALQASLYHANLSIVPVLVYVLPKWTHGLFFHTASLYDKLFQILCWSKCSFFFPARWL